MTCILWSFWYFLDVFSIVLQVDDAVVFVSSSLREKVGSGGAGWGDLGDVQIEGVRTEGCAGKTKQCNS